jgi:hypothetical protein
MIAILTVMKNNGTEQKTQIYTTIVIQFSTEETKICIKEKIASSTKGSEKTELLPAEDGN